MSLAIIHVWLYVSDREQASFHLSDVHLDNCHQFLVHSHSGDGVKFAIQL